MLVKTAGVDLAKSQRATKTSEKTLNGYDFFLLGKQIITLFKGLFQYHNP